MVRPAHFSAEKVSCYSYKLEKVKKGKDVDLYSAFHAPGTPNAHVTETDPPDQVKSSQVK